MSYQAQQVPKLQSLVDEVIARVPTLCLTVSNQTLDELKEQPQYAGLLVAWQRIRARFAKDFQSALEPMLQAARQGLDPLQRQARPTLDTLSLVDENQALQDVAIAHVVTAIEDQSKGELYQLGNFFAALRGIARPMKNDNPLRPAIFAQALLIAMKDVEANAEGRYALTKVATPILGKCLHEVYEALCQHLREAELTPLVTTFGNTIRASDPRGRAGGGSSTFGALPPHAMDVLDEMNRKVDTIDSSYRTSSYQEAADDEHFGPSVMSRLADMPMPSTGMPLFSTTTGRELLARLYDQILNDERLPASVKPLLSRLQVAIVRLSKTDSSLLKRQDHPVWRLLNRISAHSRGFEGANSEQLQQFVAFMDEPVRRLTDAPVLGSLQFQQVLTEVEDFIQQHAIQRSERSVVALAALEREQQRNSWRKLLQDQLRAQLADTAMSPILRKFLLGSWADVIVQAMVLKGRDSAEAEAAINLVDELLESLLPRESDRARQDLRTALPGLIQRIELGMDSIAMSPADRQPVLNDLMQTHGRILRGQPAPSYPQPSPRARDEDLTPEELLQRLLSERESQMHSSRWAHSQVDRGVLRTVPARLYSETKSPDAQIAIDNWMDRLQIGTWYHLFVQSQWLTAQIAWISESRQFFLFVGQDADERHSLTRGALEQLLANGLITELEEETLVQRAVTTMMQNLGSTTI